MNASFEYQLSKDDYLRGLRAVAQSIVAKNTSRRQSFELIAVLALVVVTVSVIDPGSLDAILFTLVLTVAAGYVIQARFARRWRELTFDPERWKIAISMDEHGVVTRQSDVERRYPGDAVRRIHELPEAVVLEFADWYALPMPDQLWAGPIERSAFVEEVRSSATQLLVNMPRPTAPTGTTLLLYLLGTMAIGFLAMIATETGIKLAGFNNCSCVFRRSFLGQVAAIAPFAAYFAALAPAWLGLRWLRRRWPRIAAAVAIIVIVVFVASQVIPAFLEIHRFFIRPVL
jgi:hypothetical protein